MHFDSLLHWVVGDCRDDNIFSDNSCNFSLCFGVLFSSAIFSAVASLLLFELLKISTCLFFSNVLKTKLMILSFVFCSIFSDFINLELLYYWIFICIFLFIYYNLIK